MARSLASLSKRKKIIKTTQKITNAMKLVSISKLQRYRLTLQNFLPVYNMISDLDSEELATDKEVLYLAFSADLGLASSYTRELLSFIHNLDNPKLLYIGTQGYEELINKGYGTPLNAKMSGEHVDVEVIVELCQAYQTQYEIRVLVAQANLSAGVSFSVIDTSRLLRKNYDQVFEPDYETANRAYQDMFLISMVIHGYYTSKMSEYTVRRIAMEKSSENAEGMLYDLQLQYNRLRQEKITEEIADLTAAESE